MNNNINNNNNNDNVIITLTMPVGQVAGRRKREWEQQIARTQPTTACCSEMHALSDFTQQ